jgi:hypothetical protein
MDFNKLFGRIRDIDQGKTVVNECGMPVPMESNIPHVPPVSMNVNLNAQGIDQIKDLLNLMHKADSPLAAGPVGAPPMIPPGAPAIPAPASPLAAGPVDMGMNAEPDVDPLDDIIKKAGIAVRPKEEPAKPQEDGGTDSPAPKDEMAQVADEVQDMADTLADVNDGKNPEESYANSPDEKYGDVDSVTRTGNDIHSKGKEAPKVNGGGNPFATESIRAQLDARYKEIKEGKGKKPDFLDMDKDGDKKEPMKKALKDKEVAEGWDDMVKASKEQKGTGKFDKKEIKPGVTQYTRKSNTFSDGGDDTDTKKAKQKAKAK